MPKKKKDWGETSYPVKKPKKQKVHKSKEDESEKTDGKKRKYDFYEGPRRKNKDLKNKLYCDLYKNMEFSKKDYKVQDKIKHDFFKTNYEKKIAKFQEDKTKLGPISDDKWKQKFTPQPESGSNSNKIELIIKTEPKTDKTDKKTDFFKILDNEKVFEKKSDKEHQKFVKKKSKEKLITDETEIRAENDETDRDVVVEEIEAEALVKQETETTEETKTTTEAEATNELKEKIQNKDEIVKKAEQTALELENKSLTQDIFKKAEEVKVEVKTDSQIARENTGQKVIQEILRPRRKVTSLQQQFVDVGFSKQSKKFNSEKKFQAKDFERVAPSPKAHSFYQTDYFSGKNKDTFQQPTQESGPNETKEMKIQRNEYREFIKKKKKYY